MLGLATSAGFRVVPSRWGVCGVYSATTVLGSRAKSGDAAVTFGDVGVTDPQVLQGLASLRFAGPTNIQAMVLPTLMAAVNQSRPGRSQVVIGAETGSGKSHAFLIPVVSAALARVRAAGQGVGDSQQLRPQQPLALILTPNRELNAQIASMARPLFGDALVRTAVLSGTQVLSSVDGAAKAASGRPSQLPDVLVATPSALQHNISVHGMSFLAQISWVVVDEVDMLLSVPYRRDTHRALFALRRRYSPPSFIFAGATLPDSSPKSVGTYLRERWPDAVWFATQTMHRIPPKVDVRFVRLAGGQNDGSDNGRGGVGDGALSSAQVRALLEAIVPGERTLVFVNTTVGAVQAREVLASAGYSVQGLHSGAGNSRDEWKWNLAAFNAPESGVASGLAVDVLVCTDKAARGVDFRSVDHVVQVDFALNAVDYIHRNGRTGRAGAAGRVTADQGGRLEVFFFNASPSCSLPALVPPSAELLAARLEACGRGSLESAFSRRRGLRTRHKKKLRRRRRQTQNEG